MEGQSFLDIFYQMTAQYGIYAIFLLVMLEGDITLLLAGVMAHSAFFGEYSFPKLLLAGTLAGVVSDNVAYGAGRAFGASVSDFRFYRMAQPRIQRLTEKFGALTILLSKYIYGLRWAACLSYGVCRAPYLRFLLQSTISCFVWVFILSGAGYFFSSTITKLIGDFHHIGKILLVIVVVCIVGFVILERRFFKKVEDVTPERLHELEQELHEFGDELKERMHLKPHADADAQNRTDESPGERRPRRKKRRGKRRRYSNVQR